MANEQSPNCKKSLLRRVQDLLLSRPDLYDVEFCVGPNETKVTAIRILLQAASPALGKKFEYWEDAHVHGGAGQGIPVPDFDPEAFQIFVKLTMLDEWNLQALKNLKIQPNKILNLILICRAYEMEDAVKNLENLMKPFYDEFATFKNTEEFLRLTHTNLLTILSSDNLSLNELQVFDCACRWAKAECAKREIVSTAENLRLVLGDIVFQIRFPLMTANEFTKCTKRYDILTTEEGYEGLKFISSDGSQRCNLDISRIPFKMTARNTRVQSALTTKVTLSPAKNSTVVNSPPFVCNGSKKYNFFATRQKILVHGVGFLGPLDGDGSYDVTVLFRKWEWGKYFDADEVEKRIFAQRGKIFYIMFDQPITLAECSMDKWTTFYRIVYSLKGPSTKSLRRTLNKDHGLCHGKNEFRFHWKSNQLAELIYSNV